MNYRLVHLLAGSALLFVAGAACAIVLPAAGQSQADLPASVTSAAPATDISIPHFDITHFEVQGNTLLAPFTGTQRDFGDIQHAVEALENAYRDRGYTVVQVTLPEQELEQGVVQLTVVETAIGQITITGNRHVDE